MKKTKRISAGEVLTLSLLKRVDKAAYQYGGFEYYGEGSGFKVENGKVIQIKFTAIIPKKYIKGNIEKFAKDFSKTMNAGVFNLEII